ncbi:antibiotic biosynthesis monooxygenase [bacterium]|nr:antibiotic biosynthesis monooxygenase [bacterium]
MPYTCIWKYTVHEKHVDEFIETYGPNGNWVRLFRQADGYLGTELLRDLENPLRFVTIDRWESESSYKQFRQNKAAEYEAIDRACERLTVNEQLIGVFD